MKKKFAFITLLLIIIPTVALAYSPPSLWPTGYWATGGLVSCTGNGANGTQACQSLCDLVDTIINIIYFAISIAFFIIAPISFLAGGIMVMVAGANPEMLSKGKGVLKATAIGILIVLASYLIVATFVAAFGSSSLGNYVQGFGTSGGLNCSAPTSS